MQLKRKGFARTDGAFFMRTKWSHIWFHPARTALSAMFCGTQNIIYSNFGFLAKKLKNTDGAFFHAHQMESHLVSPSPHGFECNVLRNANIKLEYIPEA
jgi:hypothetical protein